MEEGKQAAEALLGPCQKRASAKDDYRAGESRRATVCVEAINQAGHHCYDTGKHFFPGANAIDRDEAFGRRIKAGGALECRATGVIEKLGPLLTMTFAISFGGSEVPRNLCGQVVRSTPVDAGPINARHHPKTPPSRHRIRVQGNRHRVFRDQKGSTQKIKQIFNLFDH
jgi:hypothetical protein